MAKPRRRVSKRPVLSEEERDRKRKRRVLVVGLIMIALMILSISSVAFYNTSPDGQQYKYGDYEFEYRPLDNGGGVLISEINDQEIEFQNLPTQVAFLEMDPAATTILQQATQVGLVADPREDVVDAGFVDYARLQLSLAIQKSFNAMLLDDERYSLPILDCSHASKEMALVVFNVTNQTTGITSDGYCIQVQGSGRELMQLKDRIIFEYYGILSQGEVVE